MSSNEGHSRLYSFSVSGLYSFVFSLPLNGEPERVLPGEEREVLHEAVDLGTDIGDVVFGLGIREDSVDEFDDEGHVLFAESACSDSRRAEAQSGGKERRARIERHHVLVGSDIGGDQCFLGEFAGEFRELGPEVEEHTVVVGTTGDDMIAFVDESLRHDGGVLLNLLLVGLELGLQCLTERDGFGGNDMLERSALCAGEDGRVEERRHHAWFALGRSLAPWVEPVFAHEDDAAAGSA